MILRSLAILTTVAILAGASVAPAQAEGLSVLGPIVQLAAEEKTPSPQQTPTIQVTGVATGESAPPTAASTEEKPDNNTKAPSDTEDPEYAGCLSWRFVTFPLCLVNDNKLNKINKENREKKEEEPVLASGQ